MQLQDDGYAQRTRQVCVASVFKVGLRRAVFQLAAGLLVAPSGCVRTDLPYSKLHDADCHFEGLKSLIIQRFSV